MTDERVRCGWAGDDPLYRAYHDEEWGRPSRDDRHLFEMLVLEGAQAGLSWITILRKRENYRKAFDGFDPAKMARYSTRKVESLLRNPGIVRNRLKIAGAIASAKAYRDVVKTEGSFHEYLWRFVDGEPIINHWKTLKQVPPKTSRSEAMSRDLARRGFRFVGPTICYAFMQATGMVNDHLTTCYRYRALTT
jgi:DNA-3-methyladenine glycosylase I